MKRLIVKSLRLLLRPVFILFHKKRLPHYTNDFKGPRAFIIAELPGGSAHWEGERRRKAYLGNTHPWNRYFNKPLRINPKSLADIEASLITCRYLSDQKTRSQSDFWEPPDIFEKRMTGDCEDHAIWAWRQLHQLGYKARLVIGKYNEWHARVHIFANGRAYLLEATQKFKWFPNTKLYDAYWSVERVDKKKFAFFLHDGTKRDQEAGRPEFAYKWS